MDKYYYFDNNATTRISLAVSKAMAEASYYEYGNASSSYSLGLQARERVTDARKKVASLFSGEPDDIIFTSGATESNCTVIHSALKTNADRRIILTSAVEHPSVANTLKHYAEEGYVVISIPVTEAGVDLDELEQYLSRDVALMSFMAVNNETGMIFPIDEIFRCVKQFDSNIICHSDCVQAVGKANIPFSYADFLTISAHKFHGPKGIGCIYKKREVDLHPLLYGGGQEKGIRSGTENVTGIIGMGVAAAETASSLEHIEFLQRQQKKLEDALLKEGAYIVGRRADRVPGVTNVGFSGVEAYELQMQLNRKRIFVSTGSACSSNKIGISPVIRAMGVPEAYASTVRISMSKFTTEDEVDYLTETMLQLTRKLMDTQK